MKLLKSILILGCLVFVFSGCKNEEIMDGVKINLDDEIIKVDNEIITTDENEAVYIANDIIYYESGKDFTYGEGSEKDAILRMRQQRILWYILQNPEFIA